MRQSLLCIVAFLLCSVDGRCEELYPGYLWQGLDHGIYVHTRHDPLAAPIDGTSTIIINEEDVFVIDTHIDPAAARAVIAKIRELTDKPVTHVVNTHWHDDHTNGNHAFRLAFPEVRILAHRATLVALEAGWQKMEEDRRIAFDAARSHDLEAAAKAVEADDPDRAFGLRLFAGYRDALEPELATMDLVYPDTLVDERMLFERGNRTIVVQWMGPGNTDGDLIIWLPDDKVAIVGDLLVAPIPFAFDSPMVPWIETLEKVGRLGARTLIPGHGPLQHDTRYLEHVVALLRATVDAVRKARMEGTEYPRLVDEIDVSEQERLFAGGDPLRAYAWRSFFLDPGLKSAWVSLGYPVPEAK